MKGLADPDVRYYDWEQEYSAEDYVGLLATTSDIRLLSEKRRSGLFAAVTEAIGGTADPLALPMSTRLCLAWRV